MTSTRHLGPDCQKLDGREVAAEVAALWAELFDDQDLVVHAGDNFFMMGGSSRLGLEMVSRLNERFGIRLNLLTLVETETFAELAGRVAAEAGSGDEEGEL